VSWLKQNRKLTRFAATQSNQSISVQRRADEPGLTQPAVSVQPIGPPHQFPFLLPSGIPSPFSNSALTLSTHNLHVQMGQPARSRQGELDHPLDSHRVSIQVVKERSVLVVIGDEPQLSPRPVICSRRETALRRVRRRDGTRPSSVLHRVFLVRRRTAG